LHGLVAGLLVGLLVQLVFLALGLAHLIAGRVKGPAHNCRKGVAAVRAVALPK